MVSNAQMFVFRLFFHIQIEKKIQNTRSRSKEVGWGGKGDEMRSRVIAHEQRQIIVLGRHIFVLSAFWNGISHLSHPFCSYLGAVFRFSLFSSFFLWPSLSPSLLTTAFGRLEIIFLVVFLLLCCAPFELCVFFSAGAMLLIVSLAAYLLLFLAVFYLFFA